MRILVDTNVFLEVLLDQAKAEEARKLLEATGSHEMFMSDYPSTRSGCSCCGRAATTCFESSSET